MSTRCIACDCMLSDLDLLLNKCDGTAEDMCESCLEATYEEDDS